MREPHEEELEEFFLLPRNEYIHKRLKAAFVAVYGHSCEVGSVRFGRFATSAASSSLRPLNNALTEPTSEWLKRGRLKLLLTFGLSKAFFPAGLFL